MKSIYAVLALAVVLVTGCTGPGSAATAPTPDGPIIPNVVGLTLVDAASALQKVGVSYEWYVAGQRHSMSGEDFKYYRVQSTEPKAGDHLPVGAQLKTTAEADPSYSAPPTQAPVAVPEPGQTPTAPSVPEATGLAAAMRARFPGYPLIVQISKLDYRVVMCLQGGSKNDRAVALIPGLYTSYNPNVPDLNIYYESGGVCGDSAMRQQYMPDTGGATWNGIMPGPEEPQK